MSSNPGISGLPNESPSFDIGIVANRLWTDRTPPVHKIDQAVRRVPPPLSAWSASFAKRLFDIGSVVFSLPVALPAFILCALAVRLTSSGPVLFKQKRVGVGGKTFTIYKFRTMPVRAGVGSRAVVTTSINQRFTPVGPFFRRSKLDELPQLFNVLLGDMSLVGPRPKVPSHQPARLACRPGITGRATFVFACEEVALAGVPPTQLDAYYGTVVLPLKQRLDEEYMAIATFSSDLKLLIHSVLRRWDAMELSDLLPPAHEVVTVTHSIVRKDFPLQSGVLMASQNAMRARPD